MNIPGPIPRNEGHDDNEVTVLNKINAQEEDISFMQTVRNLIETVVAPQITTTKRSNITGRQVESSIRRCLTKNLNPDQANTNEVVCATLTALWTTLHKLEKEKEDNLSLRRNNTHLKNELDKLKEDTMEPNIPSTHSLSPTSLHSSITSKLQDANKLIKCASALVAHAVDNQTQTNRQPVKTSDNSEVIDLCKDDEEEQQKQKRKRSTASSDDTIENKKRHH